MFVLCIKCRHGIFTQSLLWRPHSHGGMENHVSGIKRCCIDLELYNGKLASVNQWYLGCCALWHFGGILKVGKKQEGAWKSLFPLKVPSAWRKVQTTAVMFKIEIESGTILIWCDTPPLYFPYVNRLFPVRDLLLNQGNEVSSFFCSHSFGDFTECVKLEVTLSDSCCVVPISGCWKSSPLIALLQTVQSRSSASLCGPSRRPPPLLSIMMSVVYSVWDSSCQGRDCAARRWSGRPRLPLQTSAVMDVVISEGYFWTCVCAWVRRRGPE